MDAWPRPLDQVRNDLRALHYSYRTEAGHWTKDKDIFIFAIHVCRL